MFFKQIYEEKLSQYAYLIGCQASGEAIIFDPMRDVKRYQEIARQNGLEIVAAAETHIHADYLSGLREFAEREVMVYASDEGGEDWKYQWLQNGQYNCKLLKDGDTFSIGNVSFEVMHTPGHTPEHISFKVTDGVVADEAMGILTGDFVFVGDVGRPDLLETAAGQEGAMKSSAKNLYQSVNRFKSQPEHLQVWPGHGSGSACGKALGAVPESTVGYELRYNPSIQASGDEQEFVSFVLDGQPEPPLYFARMKRDNRGGPAVLGPWPNPPKIDVDKLVEYAGQNDGAVIDTRERTKYMDAHLKGSLLAPFDKQFSTVVGSYVSENQDIYLIIDDENVDAAVRDLVRIGLDNIKGYVTPNEVKPVLHFDEAEEIETIDFEEADKRRSQDSYNILDVRKATEFSEGHLPGAVNIAHTRLKDELTKLDDRKSWVVYCRSGARASVASALLKKNGFDVTYVNDDIENGIGKES